MNDERYRLIYGETHNDVKIADDEKREYISGFPVNLLNEQDIKIKLMEEKLEEFGFEIWFLEEIIEYDENKKEIRTFKLNKNSTKSNPGKWTLLTKERVQKIQQEKGGI